MSIHHSLRTCAFLSTATWQILKKRWFPQGSSEALYNQYRLSHLQTSAHKQECRGRYILLGSACCHLYFLAGHKLAYAIIGSHSVGSSSSTGPLLAQVKVTAVERALLCVEFSMSGLSATSGGMLDAALPLLLHY